MKKILGVTCALLVMLVAGLCMQSQTTTPKSFHQDEIISKTKSFLLKKAEILVDGVINTSFEEDFYKPETRKVKQEEIQSRKGIAAYGDVLRKSDLIYTSPKITLDVTEVVATSSSEVVIHAKEEIEFSIYHHDTVTKFGNKHIFTYKKIDKDWKLSNDNIIGENSLAPTSPNK